MGEKTIYLSVLAFLHFRWQNAESIDVLFYLLHEIRVSYNFNCTGFPVPKVECSRSSFDNLSILIRIFTSFRDVFN